MAIVNNNIIGGFTSPSNNDSNYEAGYTFTPQRDIYITKFRYYSHVTLSENTKITLWDYDTKTIIQQTSISSVTANTWIECQSFESPIRLTANKKYTVSYGGTANRKTVALANLTVNSNIQIIEGCYNTNRGFYPATIDATNILALIDIQFETFDSKYLVRNIAETEIDGLAVIDIDDNIFIDGETQEIKYIADTISRVLYFPLVAGIEYTFNITGQSNKCIAGTTDKDPSLFVNLETRKLIRMLENQTSLEIEPTVDNPFVVNFIAENGEEFFIAYLSDNAEHTPEHILKGKGNYQLYTYDEQTYVLKKINDFAITSALFLEKGKNTIPLLELINTNKELNYPSVLYWEELEREEIPILKAEVKAVPPHQNIISDLINVNHSSVSRIEYVLIDCQGDPAMAVSINKTNWLIWNDDGKEWVEVSGEFSGMTKETIEGMHTEDWDKLIFIDEDKTQKIDGFYFRISLVNATQSIKEIYIKFINK